MTKSASLSTGFSEAQAPADLVIVRDMLKEFRPHIADADPVQFNHINAQLIDTHLEKLDLAITRPDLAPRILDRNDWDDYGQFVAAALTDSSCTPKTKEKHGVDKLLALANRCMDRRDTGTVSPDLHQPPELPM